MAWTTLSTVDELKEDLPMVVSAEISDTTLTNRIANAKDVVYDDLSKYVDWDEIEALDEVPRVINRLSRYRSCMETIVRNFHDDEKMIGSGETTENTLYKFFLGLYNGLLKQIEGGSIKILDSENEELEYDAFRRIGVGRIV